MGRRLSNHHHSCLAWIGAYLFVAAGLIQAAAIACFLRGRRPHRGCCWGDANQGDRRRWEERVLTGAKPAKPPVCAPAAGCLGRWSMSPKARCACAAGGGWMRVCFRLTATGSTRCGGAGPGRHCRYPPAAAGLRWWLSPGATDTSVAKGDARLGCACDRLHQKPPDRTARRGRANGRGRSP